jgi:hypothetical protein
VVHAKSIVNCRVDPFAPLNLERKTSADSSDENCILVLVAHGIKDDLEGGADGDLRCHVDTIEHVDRSLVIQPPPTAST